MQKWKTAERYSSEAEQPNDVQWRLRDEKKFDVQYVRPAKMKL